MNVHLISTPDYDKNEFNEVFDLLNTIKGAVTFVKGDEISPEELKILSPIYKEEPVFDFDDFWDLIDNCRTVKRIPSEDYVALFTSKNHHGNWFSSFDEKNVFVNTNNWVYYSERDSKYGIAFSVVENLIQTLMNLDVDNFHSDPNIHDKPIGCINDFTGRKKDIIFKLRQGYICNSCLMRIKRERVDVKVISHLKSIIDYLRFQLVDNFSMFLNDLEKEQLSVNDKGNVNVGDRELSFTPQHKSLYLLLLNNDVISTSDLEKYREELRDLYYSIKYDIQKREKENELLKKERSEVRESQKEKKLNECMLYAKNLLDITNKGEFNIVKSKVNREIINVLGEKLAEFYIIDTVSSQDLELSSYLVPLDKDLIIIDKKFKKE